MGLSVGPEGSLEEEALELNQEGYIGIGWATKQEEKLSWAKRRAEVRHTNGDSVLSG